MMKIKLLSVSFAFNLLITSCQNWSLPEKIVGPLTTTPLSSSNNVSKFIDLPYADMAYIPGGTFEMGDKRNEGYSEEKPVHSVRLDGFFMGKYEITQRQWLSVVGSNPSSFKDCLDCPVENVSWNDIQDFLRKLNSLTGKNYRLPTEAEWEYAAGGGSNNRTRFGNGLDILEANGANFYALADGVKEYSKAGENRGKTMQVGSFRSNNLGLYDMTGNVIEWCNDWYTTYASVSAVNPKGPDTGVNKVVRGGSWGSYPRDSRIEKRDGASPNYRFNRNGFRIALSQ